VYKTWAKSNKPRLSYWRFSTLSPAIFRGGARLTELSQGCVDLVRTSGDHRSIASLLQRSDILLHFQTFSTSLNFEPPAFENAAIIQARINCGRSNLVKIISEPNATRCAAFKVIRSNTEIAITPPRRSNLLQSFISSQAIHCKCSRTKFNGQGHEVKGRGYKVK